MAQHGNTTRPTRPISVDELASRVGVYPTEAYEFVQRGLHYTVAQLHGEAKRAVKENRHVSGQQLSLGLREYALMHWGGMARAVLAKWHITTTFDFGRIVFAMVEAGILNKTDEDHLEDFRNVYDFAALEAGYRIESKL